MHLTYAHKLSFESLEVQNIKDAQGVNSRASQCCDTTSEEMCTKVTENQQQTQVRRAPIGDKRII